MIDYFQGADDDFYYQVKGENGEALVTSEGYTREADAKRGFEALKRAVAATAFAPEWPGGIQHIKPLEMVVPEGQTISEMADAVGKTPLYQRGDTVLRWVNEGDTWPAPLVMPGIRLESGPTQFGDDWPGLFLRGDSCFAYALALKAERSQSGDAFSRAGVDGLITALESTNVHKS